MMDGIRQSREWKQAVESDAKVDGRLIVYDAAILCDQIEKTDIHNSPHGTFSNLSRDLLLMAILKPARAKSKQN